MNKIKQILRCYAHGMGLKSKLVDLLNYENRYGIGKLATTNPIFLFHTWLLLALSKYTAAII